MNSFFDRPFRETSHHNGFSGNTLVRGSETRSPTCLEDADADPRARRYLFLGDKLLLRRGGDTSDPLFDAAAAGALRAEAASLILLGEAPDGPRLAADVDAATPLPETVEAVDLRSLAVQDLLPAEHLGAVAQARAYLHWHRANRHCGRCGAVLEKRGGGVSRHCAPCEATHFPRVDPVVIMLAIEEDRCLLGRQARFAPGIYSALAGYLEPGETIEDAVRRETAEESGIRIGRVAYHSSQAWPFPASLMLGCHAEALTTDIVRDTEELEDCRWFTRAEVAAMLAGAHPDGVRVPPPMAIAHRLIAAFAEFAPD